MDQEVKTYIFQILPKAPEVLVEAINYRWTGIVSLYLLQTNHILQLSTIQMYTSLRVKRKKCLRLVSLSRPVCVWMGGILSRQIL